MTRQEQQPTSGFTKKRRREARRAEALTRQASESARRTRNRIILGLSSTLGAAVLVGVLALNQGRDPRSTTPTPTAAISKTAPHETLRRSNGQVVQQEVRRREIQQSIKEQKIWQERAYKISGTLPINEQTTEEAKRRIRDTIFLMAESENPVFKQTADYLIPKLESGEVKIVPRSRIPLSSSYGSGGNAAAGISSRIVEGKLVADLDISVNSVLNTSPAPYLALVLSHEIYHLLERNSFHNSLDPSLSNEEKMRQVGDLLGNRERLIREESRAHAREAEGYVYLYGHGIRQGVGSVSETHSANYIQTGSNPDGPLWRQYVAREIVRMPYFE